MKLHIIMYHYVRDLTASRYPAINGLDITLFRQQLDYLSAHFTVVSTEQVLDAMAGGPDLPENSAWLTFDDGYMDHYTNVFPLLMERGLTAFFSMPGKIIAEGAMLDVNKVHFILASTPIERLKACLMELMDHYRGIEFDFPSNGELYQELAVANRYDNRDVVFVKRVLQHRLDERLRNIIADRLFSDAISLPQAAFVKELYMGLEHVKLMKQCGMYFGIHGYDHYWLGKLPADAMKHDINKALDVFSTVLNREHWIMCYPYGSYSGETTAYLDTAGCCMGITTEVAVADTNLYSTLALPRFDTNDFPPKSENYLCS